MNAPDRDWRLWFHGGPVPDHETGDDDADTEPEYQWWRASHGGEVTGPPYWVVDQRVLAGRPLEDAVATPSVARDLLGFLPERLLTPLERDADGALPPG